MPSTYTNSLRLTLQATGENPGSWGTIVNDGVTSLVDASIAGTATVTHDNTANYTLTNINGATDEARQMFLNITGTLTAARNIVCPTASKLYFLRNNTTGGFAVTLKTSGGTGISVPSGKYAALYCDGTNVVNAFDYQSTLTANEATNIAGGIASQIPYQTGAGATAFIANGTAGQLLASNGTSVPSWQSQVLSITFIIDGGGTVITTGIKGDLEIPFACTINQWTLLADTSGSIVIDIWKDTYANYPPTVADSITGSADPTITTATKGQSSTLTGWTTSISAGDTLRFNVDSVTSITRVTLSLKVTRA